MRKRPRITPSITLPRGELKLVVSLQARLKAKSKVEVVRRGLRLLPERLRLEGRRDLAEAGEVVLDVVLDEFPEAGAAVDVGAASPRLRASEESELHVRLLSGG